MIHIWSTLPNKVSVAHGLSPQAYILDGTGQSFPKSLNPVGNGPLGSRLSLLGLDLCGL